MYNAQRRAQSVRAESIVRAPAVSVSPAGAGPVPHTHLSHSRCAMNVCRMGAWANRSFIDLYGYKRTGLK